MQYANAIYDLSMQRRRSAPLSCVQNRLEAPHAAQRLLPVARYRQRSGEDPRLGAGGGRSRLRLYRGTRSRLRRDGAGWLGSALQREGVLHETFVTLGFLAAVTKTIRLSSGILIAPQRQTGLIAKQAAEVDLLSGGRLRLGIGLGWNHVEYEALGAEWTTRGARQAEQVKVLRRLWCESLVSFKGRFHDLNDVSIVPPPVQRPIPIWFGGSSDAA